MRKLLSFLLLLTATTTMRALSVQTTNDAMTVTRIDPTDWFVGMKNPQLQLMVYGQGIRDVKSVTTNYPGVTITDVVRLDSPNYLLVYLNIKDAQPGTMTLTFEGQRSKVKGRRSKVKGQRLEGSAWTLLTNSRRAR